MPHPAPDILIDVRCLQDPNYAGRGIGRHALALLRHARDEPGLAGARLLGLVDPAMPPLLDEASVLLDAVRTTAYTGTLDRPACHVQLSPMTHDPLFVARLLHHPRIPCAAAVYDFIPLDDPSRTLPHPAARLDYHVSLRWLARHSLFLPISEDAARRLQSLLGIRRSEIVVTGAPLDPGFERAGPGGGGRHVLVVGGGDPRKNPETAIRGHARCAAVQRAGVKLVVTGDYPADWAAEQRRAAATLGGDPALLEVPGRVDEAALARLYAEALCVAAPSRAEGFSLPVAEAMAAGAPVLASSIPAHRELVEPALLFGVDDDAALAALLARAADPAWRAAVLERQAKVWPRYRAAAVAQRFWCAVAGLRPQRAPALVSGRKPRVALLTPLPPTRSGAAADGAALAGELGRAVDLDVFTGTSGPAHPDGANQVQPLTALPLLSSDYDRVVAVVGQHPHGSILRHLLRYGGACIAHGGPMLEAYHAELGRDRTVRLAEAELGRPLGPDELRLWLTGELPPGALLLGEVAQAAEPLLVRSRAVVEEVRRRYGRPALRLPPCLRHPLAPDAMAPERRRAARERLGIGPGDVMVASFGAVHPGKAPADCIWALYLLREWGIPARLHFAGAPRTEGEALRRLCVELGLQRHVRLPAAYVDEQVYRDTLLAADVGLQLRTTGLGSVSGALADCIGAGLPSVAAASLVAAAEAPGYVWAVPDQPSPVLAAGAVADLLEGCPRSGTDAERRAYAEAHGFGRYAALLCQALGIAA